MLRYLPILRLFALIPVLICPAAYSWQKEQPRPEIAPQIGINRDMIRDLEIKAATDELLRPQVASPLMAAQQLMKDNQLGPAAEKVAAAERVANKSGYERHAIARVQTSMDIQMGDAKQAARQFELAEVGKWWATNEKTASALSIAGLFYNAKDYAQAAVWYERGRQPTGPDPTTDMLRAQSLYLAADFDNAAKALETLVQTKVADNQKPSEISLKLLADARTKTGDGPGVERAAALLQRFYPAKTP